MSGRSLSSVPWKGMGEASAGGPVRWGDWSGDTALSRVLWLFLHQLMWGPRAHQACSSPPPLLLHNVVVVTVWVLECMVLSRTRKGNSPRRQNILS